ncbi:acyl-CoA thioesterase [Pseudomonas capeferrum]|uniref:acyl-CoA thioesterase n=1 Tax=Pseudomonas capeferrum TaxID=1495066 RepID=UPI0021590576|nr:thioesterase family protein [Pseudomonas capeferrum]
MTDLTHRQRFTHFHPILTRYQDADLNGHIGGALVHGYFETAILAFLAQQAGLDLREGPITGFVVSSSADFLALPSFPDSLQVGIGVARLGGSTVEYQLALFRVAEDEACAVGNVVQVFVDRATGAPVTVTGDLHVVLSGLLMPT